ncbi:MAG: MerR family transcriptional regulator [Pseudomonas sp.]
MNPDSALDAATRSSEWLSIREMENITGVSAATLRAWEYRYGLITPKRTPRGHRLYAAQHVRRVFDVIACLQRGVPTSEIKRLLQHESGTPDTADRPT